MNNVIISGEQQRDSDVHTHVSIVLQTPLPSRLPHNIEQSSLRRTVSPCWLSIMFRCFNYCWALKLCGCTCPHSQFCPSCISRVVFSPDGALSSRSLPHILQWNWQSLSCSQLCIPVQSPFKGHRILEAGTREILGSSKHVQKALCPWFHHTSFCCLSFVIPG